MKQFLLFFLLITSQISSAQEVWSLQKCIDYAHNNNIQFKITALGLDLVDQDLKANRLSRFPSLNGNINFGEYFGRNVDPTTYQFTNQAINTSQFGLNSNFNLYSGLRNKLTQEQLMLDKNATMYDIIKSKNDLSLLIATAYLQILLSYEQLNSAKNFESLQQIQYNRLKESFRLGAVPISNLAEMEAQLVTALSTTTTAENAVKSSLANLKLLLELPAEKSFEIERIQIELFKTENEIPPTTEIYNIALNNQPQFVSRDFRIKSAKKSIEIAKSYQKPTISLFGSINSSYSSAARRIKSVSFTNQTIGYVLDTIPITVPSSDAIFEKNPAFTQFDQNFNQSLGLSVNFPIFNGGQVKTGIAKSQIALKQQELQLEADKRLLSRDIQTAVLDVETSKVKYENALKNQEALSKSLSFIESKFKLGMLTSFEYNTSQNNVLVAEIQTLQAKYEYIFKMKVLDFYQGKLIKF